MSALSDEWAGIEALLPHGWSEKARELGAFERARRLESPGHLLRLLLFHAANDLGTQATAAQASASGLATLTGRALLECMNRSGPWLQWIATAMTEEFRANAPLRGSGHRLRVVDGTTVQCPGAKGTEHRLHYCIDLATATCDWHELTDASGAELLERTPVSHGDVILADRNYLRFEGVRSVVDAGGHVLVRVRASHPPLVDGNGDELDVLDCVRSLAVKEVGEWDARLVDAKGQKSEIPCRIVATRLPAPLAERNVRKARQKASKKQKNVGYRALEAAKYVIVLTTLNRDQLSASDALELYRSRWQIEVVFKRLKQVLKIGRAPHKVPENGRAWILSKLVLALLFERLHRNAMTFSPWGFDLQAERGRRTG